MVARQPLGDLYDKLRHAMKLLLEYQQNPGYWKADDTLKEAEEVARFVYNNERVRTICRLFAFYFLFFKAMESKAY